MKVEDGNGNFGDQQQCENGEISFHIKRSTVRLQQVQPDNGFILDYSLPQSIFLETNMIMANMANRPILPTNKA